MPEQIRESERICVFRSTRTGRIVGFGKMGMPALIPGLERIELFYGHEMDAWADRFRAQEEEDRHMENAVLSEREAPARKALREALLARRAVVGSRDQHYIDVNIAVIDQRHERMLAKRKASATQGYLLHEKFENSPHLLENVTFDSPILKKAAEEAKNV